MSEHTELFPIGELARRTGLPVRTIRFWSDSGVVEPAGRSAGGYRLYDAAAIARLDLVRTLRELGVDLDTVRRVLARQLTMREVAVAHLDALEAEIRTLQVRRAVLRWVARHGSTAKEMRLMNELARMSAQERQRIIDDFVRDTFAGVDQDPPGADIAQAMRIMPATLPAEPTDEQMDAWVELAELVSDGDFRRCTREMAVTGAQHNGQLEGFAPEQVIERAGAAVRAGIAPESAAGQQVLDSMVSPDMSATERARLADQTATFTDRRVERYWQLLGILNGWPERPAHVPAFEWLITALRAPRRQ